jgi:hypothetical protein
VKFDELTDVYFVSMASLLSLFQFAFVNFSFDELFSQLDYLPKVIFKTSARTRIEVDLSLTAARQKNPKSFQQRLDFMFSIFINFCNDEHKLKKVPRKPSQIERPCVECRTNNLCFTSLYPSAFNLRLNENIRKNSSESSFDDDGYLDEQEDPMTDQQTQNNQASTLPAGAGNTLPIKSTGNASRPVNFCSQKHDTFQI